MIMKLITIMVACWLHHFSPLLSDLTDSSTQSEDMPVRQGIPFQRKLKGCRWCDLSVPVEAYPNDILLGPQHCNNIMETAREDELLAMENIFGPEEFRRSETSSDGVMQVCPHLPRDFKLIKKGTIMSGCILFVHFK